MMPKVKLGDLVTITGGGTPSKSDESFWNGEIPWMSVKDLRGNIVYNTTDTITPKGLANCASNLVKKGTLVMATRMAVGKVVYAGVDLAINQDLKALSLKPVLFHRYLFYQLISKQSYFENHSKGATVKGITLDVIKQLDIHLPPLEDQKKIAAILDAADDNRQKTKALIEKYDQLTKSLFLDMFGDPVTNPKGWDKVELVEIVKLVTKGTTPTSLGEKFTSSGIRFLRAQNIVNGKVLIDDDILFIAEETHNKKLNRSHIKRGDVLLTIAGTIGRVAIVTMDEELNCNQAVAIIRLGKSKIQADYLCHFFAGSNAQSQFSKGKVTATIPNLSLSQIKKLIIPIPNVELQDAFTQRISQLEKQKQQAEASLVKAEELFNSLLQRAFKGELTN